MFPPGFRIVAVVAALWVTAASLAADVILEEFDHTSLWEGDWGACSSLPGALRIAETRGHLEFSTSSAFSPGLEVARIISTWGISRAQSFKFRVMETFTPQTYPGDEAGLFVHLAAVETPRLLNCQLEDGLLIRRGTERVGGVDLTTVVVERIVNGSFIVLYRFQQTDPTSSLLHQVLPATSQDITISVPKSANTLFVTFDLTQPADRQLRISFSSYFDTKISLPLGIFSAKGLLRLSMGGYARGNVGFIDGLRASMDSLVLADGMATMSPRNLQASQSSGDGVHLTWTAMPGATRYDVYRTGSGKIGSSVTPSYVDVTAPAGVTCEYQVTATYPPETSLKCRPVTGKRLLPAPTGLTASDGTSAAKVTLGWTAVSGAIRYRILRGIGSASTDITPTAPTINGTTFDDTTAVPGTIYTYAVKVVTIEGESVPSAVDVGHRALSAPPTLTAADGATTTGVALTWTASTGATRYRILRGVGSASTDITPATPTITATTFNDTTAVPGTIYTYAVKAAGPVGVAESPASPSDPGHRGLAAPAGLSAGDGVRTDAVTLTWTASPGAVRYRVLRGVGGATTDVTPAAPAITGTTFDDTGAPSGVVLTYAVRAVGAAGVADSALSATNTGWRNVAPPVITATDGASTAHVLVAWPVRSDCSGFKVLRSLGTAAPTQLGGVLPGTATSFPDTTSVAGTVYTYSVKAVTAAGDSAASAPDTGYRALSAPGSLTATDGTSTTQVTLAWTVTPGAVRYRIFRGVGSADTDITPASPTVTRGSFVDTTASPGVLYTYAVKAVGATGVADSEASVANTGYRSLTAPTGLIASDGTSTTAVDLAWTASPGAVRYRILRGVGSASTDITPSGAPVVAGAFSDTSAVPGTIYTYAVKAVGPEGVADSLASVVNTGHRALTAPTGLAATDGTSTAQVTLTWTAVPGATRYRIYRGIGSATTEITPRTPVITGVTFNDTTAVAGTVYTYAVTAAGPTGVMESARSGSDTGWRNLVAPASLVATDNLTTKVGLSWKAVTGATGYRVLRGASAGTLADLATVAGVAYDDTSAVPGTTYTYAVRALSAGGASSTSATDTGLRVSTLTPSGLTVAGGAWDGAGGASGPKPLQTLPPDGAVPMPTETAASATDAASTPLERFMRLSTVTAQAPIDCTLDTTEDAEAHDEALQPIDLDQDGVPDLCQLRAGDLDLDGGIGAGDVAILLTLIGSEPFESIGDFDGDGVIDAEDLAALLDRASAQAD